MLNYKLKMNELIDKCLGRVCPW